VINFNIVGTIVDDNFTELRGLSDIKIVSISGSFVLVVASEADGAITSYSLDGNGAVTLSDSQSFSSVSGTGRVSALGLAQVSGETILLPATRYEDQTSFFTLTNDGTLSGPTATGVSGISGEGIGLNETVVIGSNSFVFVQSYGGQKLRVYSLGANKRLTQLQEIADTETSYIGDISALAHWRIGANTYLFVASAFDAGLSSYHIGNDGRLALQDTVAPIDGSGFAKPQDIEVFEVDGQAYVVMASAGTSSLTVYSVADNGALTQVDHLIDTGGTRFQNANHIEAFTFEGRQFLVVAGSDDGITVLEVLAGGILRVESSLADSYDTTLDNVSGLSVALFNGIPVLYVSSATDHGFTRIELTIEPPAKVIKGTKGDDTLVGTSGDDTIEGGAGNDTIDGGAGADVLIDGKGVDHLHGSHGVDIFTFVKDGDTDYIQDFNPDWDLIDLSAMTDVTGFSDLRIVRGCEGIMIYAGGEFLILDADRHHLEIADLTAAHFIF